METKEGDIRLGHILALLTFYCETFFRNFLHLLITINEENYIL